MATSAKKRLFFGFEVQSPWPDNLPSGRLIAERYRHMTLVFLGQVDEATKADLLLEVPRPEFQIGLTGHFDRPLYLPETHPRVVAWHASCTEHGTALYTYQNQLVTHVQSKGVKVLSGQKFLPHVSICREPFSIIDWDRSFAKLPFYIKDLHLYESVGALKYKPVWSYAMIPPFEELDHTADLAFLVKGETISQIYLHAQTALCFHFPPLQDYIKDQKQIQTVDEIVMLLNEWIAVADVNVGCPFKAVSFHGDIYQKEGYMEWEMIVDV